MHDYDIKIYCPACGKLQVPKNALLCEDSAHCRSIAKIAINCPCGCDCVVNMYNMDIPCELG